jgi:hypothetical protein
MMGICTPPGILFYSLCKKPTFSHDHKLPTSTSALLHFILTAVA